MARNKKSNTNKGKEKEPNKTCTTIMARFRKNFRKRFCKEKKSITTIATNINTKTATTSTSNTTKTSSSSKNTTIIDLPELPMLRVFDFFPLRNLFHSDEVCSVWQAQKKEALCRRTHLIIARSPDNLDCFLPENSTIEKDIYLKLKEPLERHAFYIDYKQMSLEATFDRLKTLLPKVNNFKLALMYGSSQDLEKCTQLLDHYRHQLKEVSIVFWGFAEHTQQVFTTLMDSLNNLEKLQKLEVNFRAAPGCLVKIADDQLVRHSLPNIAGRLETLQFSVQLEYSGPSGGFHRHDARLVKQVLFEMRDRREESAADKSAAKSSKLKQQQQQKPNKQQNLELYFPLVPLTLPTLISLGPGPVAAGLRSVKIDGVFSANSKTMYENLAQLARLSPHLQTLSLTLECCLSIWRLVEPLVSLKELVSLKIISFKPNPLVEKVDVCQLPVLSCVKSLQLEIPEYSHHQYEEMHLEILFPSLQMAYLIYKGWQCSECNYKIPFNILPCLRQGRSDHMNVPQFNADYGKQIQNCLRKIRMSVFSRLPNLTKLIMRASPLGAPLPFKPHLFISMQSLNQQTEFVDWFENRSQKFDVYQ